VALERRIERTLISMTTLTAGVGVGEDNGGQHPRQSAQT
jgi:hypothetical protein